MQNNIKLIALDMDGTSFYKAGGIIESNIEPIKQAEESGVKIVFVTGRPLNCKFNNDIKLHNMIKDDTIMIGFNGALVRNLKTNEILHKDLIPSSVVEEVFKLARNEYANDKISIWCYTDDEELCVVNNIVDEDQCLKNENRFFDGLVIYDDEVKKWKSAYKFIIKSSSQDYIDKIKSLGLNYFGSVDIASEVVTKTVSKKSALEFLSKYFDIDPTYMLAAGDAANDVPMLEYAGVSFTVNNAKDEAKKAAKFISDLDAEQGAIGKIIKDFILD